MARVQLPGLLLNRSLRLIWCAARWRRMPNSPPRELRLIAPARVCDRRDCDRIRPWILSGRTASSIHLGKARLRSGSLCRWNWEASADSPERTILDACLEVGRPVVFAVMIIAIVYLPILSLTGIEGKMFKPMALTVVFALLGSLLLALTYIPAMLTLALRGKVAEAESPVTRSRVAPTNPRAPLSCGGG